MALLRGRLAPDPDDASVPPQAAGEAENLLDLLLTAGTAPIEAAVPARLGKAHTTRAQQSQRRE